MPPAGRSSSGQIIGGFDHGWSRDGRARYRGSQNLVDRARRRNKREKGDSGSLASPAARSGHGSSGARGGGHRRCDSGVFRKKWLLSRARNEETRKRSGSGSLVLAGDIANGDWRRRRRPSPVVGVAVAA
ncbi:hypothetical protein DEO72_LG9g1539 [Vigna unguiculata]|uniref:Uncharacterized protein n=1 Tax=Vigna unguiculata TaxID=3917 RepID=A0A4D6LRR8_VIGUN|nr:hypothetical protein DEO72_LG4g2242 [Vigna unguiculata]QCE06526.1 hypothetical protein DEO72_LG9g1539 [Vigna unguiculata]